MVQQATEKDSGGLFSRMGKAGEPAGEWITAFCDGGSRGNPGPSGFGVYIQDEKGTALAELSEFLGRKTNNFAEYSGLLAALNFAIEQGHSRLRVVSDSELMVKQIKGQYRVNSPDLKPLYEEAKRRIARLGQFQVQHVLRDKNKNADRLANLAMDRGAGGAREQTATQAPARTLDFRAAVKAASGRSAAPATAPAPNPAAAPAPKSLRGLVKGGVVQMLEGELPEGIFVRVTPERG